MRLTVAADNGPVRSEEPQVSIQALRDKHPGETAWIVGKGPSLVFLSKEHIGAGPVIAINEAVIAVERLGLENPIYSMQKDADEYGVDPNYFVRVEGTSYIPLTSAALLVHQHESPNRMPDYRPRFVFDNAADFGLDWWEFSSLVSIAVAKLMGCQRLVYVSHDACVTGESRSCDPRPDGTLVILGVDENYQHHRRRIDEYLERVGMPADWLTPEAGGAGRIDDGREVRRLTAALARSEGEGHRLAVALAQRESELRQVADELALVTSSLALARTELDSAVRQVDAAESHVNSLLSSRSWRWMAPVRKAHEMLTRSKQ